MHTQLRIGLLCVDLGDPDLRARASDLHKQGRSRATQANVMFGVAGAAAATAAALWFTGAPESRVALTPSAGRSVAGRSVAGLDVAVRL